MTRLLIGLINFYQQYLSLDRGALSLLVPGGACKYNPTCSEYMKISILRYGVLRGTVKGLQRIMTCY